MADKQSEREALASKLLLDTTKEELINGMKLIIGRENGKPWTEVTDEDVLGYVEFLWEKPEVKDGTE